MILGTLRLQGMTRFRKEVAVDFGAMGSGLFAVSAKNGQGKTTLMDASGCAILFRECPTRETTSLPAAFPSGEGSLFLSFEVAGRQYEASLGIRKGDLGYAILKRDGDPFASGAKAYAEAIKGIVGPKDAFYASAYAMQGGGGRLSSLDDQAKRKAIFRHFLQLDRLEKLKKEAKRRLDELTEFSRALTAVEEDLPFLEKKISEKTAERKQNAKDLVLKEAAFNKAKAAMEAFKDVEAALAALAAFRRHHSTLSSAVEDSVESIVQLQETIEGLEERLATPLVQPPSPAKLRAELDGLRDKNTALVRQQGEVGRLLVDVEAASRSEEILADVPCEGEFPECRFLVDAAADVKDLPKRQSVYEKANADLEKALANLPDMKALQKRVFDAETAERAYLQAKAKRDADQVRLTELKEALEDELAAGEKTTTALEELGDEPEAPDTSPEKIKQARATLSQAEAALDAERRTKGAVDGALEQHRASLEKLKRRRDELQPKIVDKPALDFLCLALGTNGIQAMEIDACGPEVSGIANDLLAGSYGARFSVRIATTRETKAGNEAQDLLIRVLDATREGGRECSIGDLSGGEQVVVDEAIRTALSIYANGHLDQPYRTLWRDEPMGALDEENARHYVDLLRAAKSLGNFHQVLVVSHNMTVVGAVDGVLKLNDGVIKFRRNG